ncbi:ExbD/TolR family protein [Roseomonas oryzicola]|uniref:ExbD/TolR family protein n=2 Tax=Neoroseomonas oryzicola TaxID=535904 RepID=A0A9X9WDI0_9PROT|nr:ExbD/TolR family protein [Neoroseomonas oryzicola]NKE17579.1 ExbD/TolR family protein [Neoroseomonas oryzicola]
MSVGGSEDDDDAAPMSEINVTPLVDVMLVLLIIFMVAAPMMTAGVPVELPRTAAPRATSPSPPVVLSVTREGAIHIGEERIEEAVLAQRLMALKAENPEIVVHVRGDRAVPYGEVLRIMGRVTAAGIPRVSLISDVERGGAAR